MIAWIGAAWLVYGFLICMRLFALVEVSKKTISHARDSLGVIRHADMTDDDKEKALQRHAVQLWLCFMKLLLGGAAAIVLPAAVVLGLDAMGWVSWDETLRVAISPLFIGLSFLAISTAILGKKRR